jgi:glutamyl-tRNA reductase
MTTPAQTADGKYGILAAYEIHPRTISSMNTCELLLVGATHRTAPLGLREKFSLSADNEATLAAGLAAMPGVRELVILSTCNRVEIYVVGGAAVRPAQVAAAFCACQGFDPEEFASLRLELSGRAAVQHLFEVSSGLDSQMLGENEIFGQVKRAYLSAQSRGLTGPVLNKIFQKAFQAAKHVRTHTAITAGLVSVSNVAVELAASVFGELGAARILLLGAGEIGLKSGRAFRSRRPAVLAVASRRLDRAQEVAVELEAQAMPFEQAMTDLGNFDVVVCSTAAPTTVIAPAAVAAAMRRRAGRPLFFIDVAMPRDVDAEVAALENVFLYNLDDLAKIAAENRSARHAEIALCCQILTLKTGDLWSRIETLLGREPASAAANGNFYPMPCRSVEAAAAMALCPAAC